MTEEVHSPAYVPTLTSLLDAPRTGGLTCRRDGGPLLASVQSLDGNGQSYATHLVELAADANTDYPSPRRLTRGAASIGATAVAEDGSVFFTAKRAGDDGDEADDAALFLLPARGEARRIATRPGGFGSIALRPGVLVAQLAVHSHAGSEEEHAEFVKMRSDAKVSGILHTEFPTRRWDADLGPHVNRLAVAQLPQDLSQLSSTSDDFAHKRDGDDLPPLLEFTYPQMPEGSLVGWEASADGTWALVSVRRTLMDHIDQVSIHRVDLTGKQAPQQLLTSQPTDSRWLGALSPDDARVVIEHVDEWMPDQDLHPRPHVHTIDGDGGLSGEQPLWPEFDQWFDAVWLDDNTLVAASDDHGRGSVWIGGLNDAAPRRLAGGPEQKYVFSAVAVHDGRVVALRSSIDTPPQPVAIDPASGEVTELANPTGAVEVPGRLDEVTATAEDGTEVRAWLSLPDVDGPHPLVVFAHGGPWGSWNAWTYRWNPAPFVAAGFAVLLPDPAISTGYGQYMIARGQQQLGGTPFTDIMALTDAAEERTDIDSERTAFAGGSYGGYMTNWVAGHTGARFKCAVTHASLWNTESMGRTTDNSSWNDAMAGQSKEYSPHLYAADIEIPMLVIHGDKDYRVPIGQGQELWFDLLRKSKTPAGPDGLTQHRFLYFPDEGHWILGRGNAEVWYRTFIDFLRHHVLDEETQTAEELG